MDFLIEFILDLIIDSGIESINNRKIPLMGRCFILIFLILLFSSFFLGVLVLGLVILKKDFYTGIFILLIGLILLVMGILRFKEIYRKKKF